MSPEQKALLEQIVPGAVPAFEYYPAGATAWYKESTVTALLDALAACREDAERLQWMIDHPDATIISDGPYGPFHIWFRYSCRIVGEGSKTSRDAIDAARGGA